MTQDWLRLTSRRAPGARPARARRVGPSSVFGPGRLAGQAGQPGRPAGLVLYESLYIFPLGWATGPASRPGSIHLSRRSVAPCGVTQQQFRSKRSGRKAMLCHHSGKSASGLAEALVLRMPRAREAGVACSVGPASEH